MMISFYNNTHSARRYPFLNPIKRNELTSNRRLSSPHFAFPSLSPPSMEELASGAGGRIIPILRNLRRNAVSVSFDSLCRSLILVHSIFLRFVLFLRRRRLFPAEVRRFGRGEEEDTLRRRALAEDLEMVSDAECRSETDLFYGVGRHALFVRSWFPVTGERKGILVVIHGLNEHSGRYAQFAKQLTMSNFGVYAMDWIGHGGSDGLHGYVPSLDHVVADTCSFLEKIQSENPGIPCFLFGHSTGGAIVLKAASHPHIESMLEGIILTSPALRVKPAHPIIVAVAPFLSLVVPRFQLKGANKRGIPVTRDPIALLAKYSDPLVYTGPIRVRTGHEILRISSYLLRNFKSITIPFFVLHGTADQVTDPLASQDLYYEAASQFKDIKLYKGFLHDLLFEPEHDEVARDIIDWMEQRLSAGGFENVNSQW